MSIQILKLSPVKGESPMIWLWLAEQGWYFSDVVCGHGFIHVHVHVVKIQEHLSAPLSHYLKSIEG